jgi:multiple sugar transport system ATP-binding protein
VAGGEMLRMVLPEAIAASIRTGDSASIAIDNRKIHVFRAVSGQAMT